VWLAVAGIGAVVVAVVAFVALRPGGGAGQPSSAPRSFTGSLAPPNATPLTSPPAEPASSGVTATIETRLGKIVIEVFDESAPVSATNFLNLASAGYYNGTTFHRLVPNFVIQGGDPDGNGRGGPGYTIQDEPVVGDYARGIVAMARTREPNSQGSQFFIVLADAARTALDAARTYTIFGRVTSGMEVVDAIAAMPNAGSNAGNAAIDPVVMDRVTVQRP
jgi:peptidyl-prolyl cis-trans isomerase B (cyclophilin B)